MEWWLAGVSELDALSPEDIYESKCEENIQLAQISVLFATEKTTLR